MSSIETLRDAFLDEVRDLYSAENQLLKALPKVEKRASTASLKEAIRSHIEETQGQVQRLEQIGKILGEKMTGKTCQAMKGLCEEAAEVLSEDSENESLIDALLIGACLRVEHYEMAGYGTARAMAEALGEDECASLLQETLDEEGEANKTLSDIIQDDVLPQCADESSTESSDDSDESDDSSDKKSPRSSKTPSRETSMSAKGRNASKTRGMK